MAILSLQHVTYCYNPDQKDAFNAVDDVTLDIEQGEFLSLIHISWRSISGRHG